MKMYAAILGFLHADRQTDVAKLLFTCLQHCCGYTEKG
jgi:hypothetical protein